MISLRRNPSSFSRALAFGCLIALAGSSYLSQAAAQTVSACTSHSDCAVNEYCGDFGFCHACELCNGDAIDGNCPTCLSTTMGIRCQAHTDCAQTQYCDSDSNCITCQACVSLLDGIDGACPDWCDPSYNSAGTENLAQETLVGGKKSNGGAIAVGIIGTLMLIGAAVGALYYIRRRQEEDEVTLLEVNKALDAREQAEEKLRTMNNRRDSMIISIGNPDASDSSDTTTESFSGAALRGHRIVERGDEKGEYIDVDDMPSRHNTLRPSASAGLGGGSNGLSLYDDEFLEMARDLNVAI